MKHFFSLGELRISIEFETGGYELFLDRSLEAFAVEPFEISDIRFRVDTTSPFPSLDSCLETFTSRPDGLWTILEDKDKTGYLIALQNVAGEAQPYKIITADRKFTDFIIYTRPNAEGKLFPLEYPLADLAVSGHININRIGIILHSACISLKGKGYLFAGVSGSGKSTISEIWKRDSEAEVLTDERVLVRAFEGDLWAFGTPWHGTSEIHKNLGAPIEKIFFIEHGKENKAIPISKTEATNKLMVRCFPVFWERGGVEFALDFCARITHMKKCYDFQFLPDGSASGFIKKLDESDPG